MGGEILIHDRDEYFVLGRADVLVDVEIVRGVDQAIIAVLPFSSVQSRSSELVKVHAEVWVEVDEFAPDVPGLLSVELVEIAVWVVIRC